MFIELNPFIKLFKNYFKLIFPSFDTGGTGGTGGYGGSSGPYTPSLYDLTTKDIGSIMRDMGFSEDEISKYSGYAPTYDPWKEEFAAEEKLLAERRLDIEKTGLGRERELTEDLYGIGKQSMQRQIFGVSQAGEQSLYDVFQQGSAIESAGLGARSSLAKRGRKSVIGQTSQQSEMIGLQGLEQTKRYESALEGFDDRLDMIGIEEAGLDVQYRRDVESAQREYEDDFWDFMTFLQTNFEIGFDD